MEKSRYTKKSDEINLFAKNAGRCALCNKNILQDVFEVYDLNLSEKAHILPHSDIGPRSEFGSGDAVEENLILLCPICHETIDNKITSGIYTLDTVAKIKKEHEDFIGKITNFTIKDQISVIMLQGAIRGNVSIISKQKIFEATLQNNQIPEKYLDINLNNLIEDDTLEYWNSGKKIIDTRIKEYFDQGNEEKSIYNNSAIFGLSRIPFLIYLGYVISDKIPTTIYQKNRINESWVFENNQSNIDYKINKINNSDDDKDNIVVIISVSGKINKSEIPASLQNFNIYEIQVEDENFSRDLIKSETDLLKFQNIYERLLRDIEKTYNKSGKIHLIPAIPLSLSIICGRNILKSITQDFVIYDKSLTGLGYIETITINNK